MRINILRNFHVFLLITASFFSQNNEAKAASRYAVATGNWSSSIWASTAGGFAGSASTPGSNDDVTINNGVTVSLTGNASAKSVTVGVAGAGSATLRYNTSSSVTVTVANDVNVNDGTFTVNGVGGNNSYALLIGGNLSVPSGNSFDMTSSDGSDVCNVTFNKNGSATVSGTGTVDFYNITLGMGSSSSNILDVQSVITMHNGGLTLTNGVFKLSSASTIVPFTSDITSSPYLIPNTGGLWCNGGTINSSTSCDWTVDGYLRVSSGTVNLGIAADDRFRTVSGSLIIDGGVFNVAGRITYTSASASPLVFNMSGGTLNVPTIGSTSTNVAPFDMSDVTGSFTMSGGTIVIKRAGGGTNYFGFQCYANTSNVTGGTLQIGDATTPASQTMRIETSVPLYNLTVNSANAKAQFNASSNIVIKHDVTLTAGQLDANGISCSVGNDWMNNSSATAFTPSTAGVTFNGSNAQNIGGTFSTNFNNLIINNSTGTLASATTTLGNDINVSALLTMTRGFIVSSSTNILNMLAGSSATGSSASSYVNGPMAKAGTTAFVFPVGYGNGTKWARIGIGAPSSSTTFTAQYFAYPYSNTVTMATTPSPVLNNVSKNEYWQLDKSVGAGNATVTLYWENAAWSGINQCSTTDLRVARWNSAAWENNNNSVTTTGTCTGATSGTVSTTAVVTLFGTVTFGSLSGGVNPLPVELISFKGNYIDRSVQLKWSTLTETNNDHFEIQRSLNGKDFITIGTVKGSGNSNALRNYNLTDTSPSNGINYYRLNQVDYNGATSLSRVISASAPNSNNIVATIYPNPAGETASIYLVNSNSGSEFFNITINDVTGKTIVRQQEVLIKEQGTVALQISSLSKGLYIVNISNEAGTILTEQKLAIVK